MGVGDGGDGDCTSSAPYIDRVLRLERLSRRVDCIEFSDWRGVRGAFALVSRRV